MRLNEYMNIMKWTNMSDQKSSHMIKNSLIKLAQPFVVFILKIEIV